MINVMSNCSLKGLFQTTDNIRHSPAKLDIVLYNNNLFKYIIKFILGKNKANIYN